MALALTLSGSHSIPADAPSGSVVGTFSADRVRFQGARPEALLIVGRLLVTTWEGLSNLAQIPIIVHGPGGPPANFTITITSPSVMPPPLSPDGSIISGGTGSLRTADGTWSFGPTRSGAWEVFLNGSWAASGISDKLQVAHGAMYAHNAGGWWVWQSGSWQNAADPNTPPPARTLLLTIALAAPTFEDTIPSGTVLATGVVKYSDGTTPASVTLTSSDPSFAKIAGMQIVSARALIPGNQAAGGDDYTHDVSITASDGLGALVTARLFGAS